MNNYLLHLSLIIPLFVGGCKKKDDCTAGMGGKLTIVAKTVHHTKPIPGCTFYVKYCAKDFPGENNLSSFDKTYKISNDSTEIAISNLQNGEYYLYATGIDSSLDPTNNIVKGGIPFNTEQKEGTIKITVPITEGD